MARASVILGQEDRGGGAIGLGDDPHLEAIVELVGAQQPVPIPEGRVVGLNILFVQIAPVAQGVAVEHGLHDVQLPALIQGQLRGPGHDDLAKFKQGLGHTRHSRVVVERGSGHGRLAIGPGFPAIQGHVRGLA